jgi:hypothetical protein
LRKSVSSRIEGSETRDCTRRCSCSSSICRSAAEARSGCASLSRRSSAISRDSERWGGGACGRVTDESYTSGWADNTRGEAPTRLKYSTYRSIHRQRYQCLFRGTNAQFAASAPSEAVGRASPLSGATFPPSGTTEGWTAPPVALSCILRAWRARALDRGHRGMNASGGGHS